MGIKRAKTKEVRRVTIAELVAADSPFKPAAPSVILEEVMLPHKQRTTQMLGGTPAEAAAALVEKLQFEVRAL
jgi:electron transfer flavoprotein alpha/beta subunit